jgi:hypothetical protein
MDFYRRCGNVARACRHFGVSRQTLYRWQRRFDPYDLTTLEKPKIVLATAVSRRGPSFAAHFSFARHAGFLRSGLVIQLPCSFSHLRNYCHGQ